MKPPSDEFLTYYLEELSYLRRMGERFARAYPKVAGRLELQADESPDPHVERLIESFAFLTARIQSDLDNDFVEIAAELLNVLYPHYLNPIPSMAIARFDFDPLRAKLTTGFEVARHTGLFASSTDGAIARVRTCYPVTLWPIEVVEAEFETPEVHEFVDPARTASVLRLRLRSHADPFEVLGVDKLRFFLNGDPVVVNKLYELLVDGTKRIAVLPAGEKRPRYVDLNPVSAVGFGEDEEVIPYPRYSHPAYRLLQEYFAFPDKFHFLDVNGLAGRVSGQEVDVLFLLDRVAPKLMIEPKTFALGCTPVVNLFKKTSEPLRVDHRQLEYRLVPDLRKEKTTEIHSILSISGSSDPADSTRDYAPFYSYTHTQERRGQRAYWHGRRVPSEHPDMRGTDILLSFRDLDFEPARPPDEIVFAQMLCTNRGLAAELPADGLLQTDQSIPVSAIVCLKKPTRPIDPPLGGQALWRLVSHLSLNYLSLGGGESGINSFREILGLYCYSDAPALRQQLQGIRTIDQKKIVRRFGDAAWKGFVRGTEVSLVMDESFYVGSSAYLLASVLQHFLGLYSSINSFTQLVIRRAGRETEEWKRWPPMAGATAVL
ncbi:MAG TPA: type VI secretion system baseplate subunit TssF [Thermoanaerobaculia bacterium]|nr:type VI secretion system baseplate subunit TssF [Thermoanaerobaculia bacterium]